MRKMLLQSLTLVTIMAVHAPWQVSLGQASQEDAFPFLGLGIVQGDHAGQHPGSFSRVMSKKEAVHNGSDATQSVHAFWNQFAGHRSGNTNHYQEPLLTASATPPWRNYVLGGKILQWASIGAFAGYVIAEFATGFQLDDELNAVVSIPLVLGASGGYVLGSILKGGGRGMAEAFHDENQNLCPDARDGNECWAEMYGQ